MVTILGAAASGLAHNQAVMDVIGHNLANVNTQGYKKFRALAEGRPDAAAQPEGGRLGVAETTRDLVFSQSASQSTDDALHFSIQDDTFFRVQDSDGSAAFTRLGSLSVDSNRNITAYRGRLLQPPVTVPEGMSQPGIDQAGVITALDESGSRQAIGQVTLVRFTNPQGLEAMGEGLYRETVNSGASSEGNPTENGFAGVIPGTLEGSNVEIAEEFTNMIIAQRAYQASAKTFSVGDAMLAIATDLTR